MKSPPANVKFKSWKSLCALHCRSSFIILCLDIQAPSTIQSHIAGSEHKDYCALKVLFIYLRAIYVLNIYNTYTKLYVPCIYGYKPKLLLRNKGIWQSYLFWVVKARLNDWIILMPTSPAACPKPRKVDYIFVYPIPAHVPSSSTIRGAWCDTPNHIIPHIICSWCVPIMYNTIYYYIYLYNKAAMFRGEFIQYCI